MNITEGICPVTGYHMQSLKCANCRFNRVEDVVRFAAASRTDKKTSGTYCVASYRTQSEGDGMQKVHTKGIQKMHTAAPATD